AGNHGLPGWISRVEEKLVRDAWLERIAKVERRTRKAYEDTTVVVRSVGNAELQAQREIAEQLRGVEEKTESPIAVTDHLAVDVQHPPAGRAGEVPVFERCSRAVEERAEAGFGLRTDNRVRFWEHAAVEQVADAPGECHAREHRVRRADGRE